MTVGFPRACRGILACGAHTAAHSRDYGRQGEVRQIPLCFHSAILDFVEYRLHKIFCHAQFQRISAHRGKKRAYVAIAHSMLIAIYHMLKDGTPFQDLGADYYNQFNQERKINAYLKKLKALGWKAPTVMTVQPA